MKKGFTFIILTILLIACGSDQNNGNVALEDLAADTKEPNNVYINAGETDVITTSETAVISPDLFNAVNADSFEINKKRIYLCNIGQYQSQAITVLIFEDETVSGFYHYSQYQKDLQLSGKVNYETGEIELEEAYKGKTSGYFKGILTESTITGKWSAKPDFQNRSDFSMQVVDINPQALRTDKGRFKKYKHSYESGLYNSETDEYDPYSTEDVIKVSFIDDRHFGFVYDISGMNGHSGTISGLAALGDSAKWYYSDQAECELKFNFIADTIKIEAQGCTDYSGFRAHFGGALTLYK